MRYRFIDEHRGRWPVRALCDALQVGPAGYYAWRVRPPSERACRRTALGKAISAIHARVKARYGSPRVHAELAARGHRCCVNTVAKVMREAGIAANSPITKGARFKIAVGDKIDRTRRRRWGISRR